MQTFLRRLEILSFLRNQKTHVSTEDILNHLSATGYVEVSDRLAKSEARLIQRDLNFLLGEEFDPGEFENDFGLSRIKGQRKSQLWRLEPYQDLHYDFEKIPAYMALALSVSQKHLKQVLPSGTQQELQRVFSSAEEKLQKSEQKLSPLHYQRLTRSVEFFQRGQSLQAPQFDMAILDTIYQAILKGKKIQFSYNKNQSKDYVLHPFGIAIMLPKIYLIGIKDEDISDYKTADFRSFLVHKIDDIFLSNVSNAVPNDFVLKDYLDAGNMDVLLNRDEGFYQLQLDLSASEGSNLLNDLIESPISSDQQLKKINKEAWQLSATVRRTVQLRNWLLALGPQAKVIKPKVIAEDLKHHISAISELYK